ncbi:MAG: GGDEF domain-containing protein [Gemmatimonadota bacterium]
MTGPETSLDRDAIQEITLAHLDDLEIPPPGRPPIPGPAIWAVGLPLLGAAALSLLLPRLAAGYAGLVWALALIPIFLLSYYRGWKGAALAVAAAMVAFVAAHVVAVQMLSVPIRWWVFGLITLALVAVAVGSGWLAERLYRERRWTMRRALEVAMKDPVTGLPTRRALDLFLRNRVAAAERGESLIVVLFDLDGLRTLNRRLGQAAGDQLLARVGEVFRETARAKDLVGRFAGEEFLAVLTDEDAAGATVFAERVRKKGADLKITDADGSLTTSGVTLSAAVVPFTSAMEGVEDLLKASYAAIEAAKEEGGDRVAVRREDQEEPRVVVKGGPESSSGPGGG